MADQSEKPWPVQMRMVGHHSGSFVKRIVALLTLLLCIPFIAAKAQGEGTLDFQSAENCNAAGVENAVAAESQWWPEAPLDRRPALREPSATSFLAEGLARPLLIQGSKPFGLLLTYACGRASGSAVPKWHVVAFTDRMYEPLHAFVFRANGLMPLANVDKFPAAKNDRLASAMSDRETLPIDLDGVLYRMRFQDIRALFGDSETLSKIDCLVIPEAIAIDRWTASDRERVTQVAVPLVVGDATYKGRSCRRRVRGNDDAELEAPLFVAALFAPRIGLYDRGGAIMAVSPRAFVSIPWTLSADDVTGSDFLISLPALRQAIRRQRTRERLTELATEIPGKSAPRLNALRDAAQSVVEAALSEAFFLERR